jgi:hypothetical protein
MYLAYLVPSREGSSNYGSCMYFSSSLKAIFCVFNSVTVNDAENRIEIA